MQLDETLRRYSELQWAIYTGDIVLFRYFMFLRITIWLESFGHSMYIENVLLTLGLSMTKV